MLKDMFKIVDQKKLDLSSSTVGQLHNLSTVTVKKKEDHLQGHDCGVASGPSSDQVNVNGDFLVLDRSSNCSQTPHNQTQSNSSPISRPASLTPITAKLGPRHGTVSPGRLFGIVSPGRLFGIVSPGRLALSDQADAQDRHLLVQAEDSVHSAKNTAGPSGRPIAAGISETFSSRLHNQAGLLDRVGMLMVEGLLNRTRDLNMLRTWTGTSTCRIELPLATM